MIGVLRHQHTAFAATLSFLVLLLFHVPLAMAAPAANPVAAVDGPQKPINVSTLNVRYSDDPPVPIPPTGAITPEGPPPKDVYAEQPWAVRRSRLVDQLLSTGHIDIMGFQEVKHHQLLDLHKLLGPNYKSVGVGRDFGNTSGEYSPIFFDTTRFEIADWKTIWLSTTPAVPSKGWDAVFPRIATILSLKDKTGGFVHAVCTHYDHIGIKARAESSLLIRKELRKWLIKIEGKVTDSPVLLFGDFNSPPDEDGYKNSVSPKPVDGSAFTFRDAYTELLTRGPNSGGQQSRPYGPEHTWTDFKAPGKTDETRIDFIMLGTTDQGKPTNWCFSQYAVIDNFVQHDADGWTGRWSDHRAVRATIQRSGGCRSKSKADKRTLNLDLKFYK